MVVMVMVMMVMVMVMCSVLEFARLALDKSTRAPMTPISHSDR